MNTLKQLEILLLALSFSSAVLAKQGGKTNPPPPPPPTTTPTPPPTTSPTPTPSSQAVIISDQPTGGSTYALFYMAPKRLLSSLSQELITLRRQLHPFGLSPCLVTTDVNASPIKCGNGLVQFGTNELYSYGRPFNLQKVPLNLDRGVKQVFGADFRSPVGLIPGDPVGRAVHVHFSQPVSQFAMNFDSGQALAPSIGAVQFIVGTGTNAVSLEQPLAPGTTQWAGVQDPAGFTDLIVVPLEGATQAFVIDQISVVTKAQFLP